jgi:hypothetical protein
VLIISTPSKFFTHFLSLSSSLRVLRRIFGPERDEIIGGWRKLRNEELHNLYSSPDIIKNQVKEDEIGRAYNMQEG